MLSGGWLTLSGGMVHRNQPGFCILFTNISIWHLICRSEDDLNLEAEDRDVSLPEGPLGLQEEEVLQQEVEVVQQEVDVVQQEVDVVQQEVEVVQQEVEVVRQEVEGQMLVEEFMDVSEDPQLPTTICLREWVEKQHQFPTLTDLFPQGHHVTLQILDFTLAEGKPTGQVLLTDGEVTIPAMLGTDGTRKRKEYVDYLVQRRFGKNWLVKVTETEGPPTSLSIVRFIHLHNYTISKPICHSIIIN